MGEYVGRAHVRTQFCSGGRHPAVNRRQNVELNKFYIDTFFIVAGTMATMTQIAPFRRPGCRRSWT